MATYDESEFIRVEGSDTCKFCGKKGLTWEETEHGWRLFDFSGVQHQCRTKIGITKKFTGERKWN